MGLLGDLLSLPVKIVNAPIRALEDVVSMGDCVSEDDRIFSKPLDLLADQLKAVDDDD